MGSSSKRQVPKVPSSPPPEPLANRTDQQNFNLIGKSAASFLFLLYARAFSAVHHKKKDCDERAKSEKCNLHDFYLLNIIITLVGCFFSSLPPLITYLIYLFISAFVPHTSRPSVHQIARNCLRENDSANRGFVSGLRLARRISRRR